MIEGHQKSQTVAAQQTTGQGRVDFGEAEVGKSRKQSASRQIAQIRRC